MYPGYGCVMVYVMSTCFLMLQHRANMDVIRLFRSYFKSGDWGLVHGVTGRRMRGLGCVVISHAPISGYRGGWHGIFLIPFLQEWGGRGVWEWLGGWGVEGKVEGGGL